ncbi:gp53-like domain-containing protein [Pseudomonas reactans]
MQKISESTNSANPAGEFTEGNPAAGAAATLLKAQWLNVIQRELVGLVLGAGISLSANDDGQVLKAVKALSGAAADFDKLLNKPTTLSGYGITDALTAEQMNAALTGKANKATTLSGYGITDAFTKPETTSAIQQAVAALVASSPAALDTLKELATALGNDPNFATTVTNALAGKLPTAGGPYRPTFNSVGVGASAGSMVNLQGGYIGWNESGFGEMHFICNAGNGNGGFTWRSVNSTNTQTGPAMSYSYSGILNVPTALFVPAITSNTTVSTQSPGYAGGFIANCAFVATSVAGRLGADNADNAGFVDASPTAAPYMRRTINSEVVRLRPASVVDTANLTANGNTKNIDTGEIIQWKEVLIGDIPGGGATIDVTWPFAFPNAFINVTSIVLRSNDASVRHITAAYYSMGTVNGCRLQVDEAQQSVQPASLTAIITARGR